MVLVDKGGSFSNDQDYIFWGNDDGVVLMIIIGKYFDYDNILVCKWMVVVNGIFGNVLVCIIFINGGFVGNYVLHVDLDEDFIVGLVSYLVSGISGDIIIFENVLFFDGDYFMMGNV